MYRPTGIKFYLSVLYLTCMAYDFILYTSFISLEMGTVSRLIGPYQSSSRTGGERIYSAGHSRSSLQYKLYSHVAYPNLPHFIALLAIAQAYAVN